MNTERPRSTERPFAPLSGWLTLAIQFAILAGVLFILIPSGPQNPLEIFLVVAGPVVAFVALFGYFIVNPNMSRVLILFGKYRGTVRNNGFFWTNPFTIKREVSLRAQNIASKTIKVNDMQGNPIEIGAVVVWVVKDTSQAVFDVEDYMEYVDIQMETAVRHLAKRHPYDDTNLEVDVPTLRGDTDEVAVELQEELQQRFERAGIEVIEARLSHLAYAPEIASAMLQRQQASAIIAARKLIVEGAVSMVEQALEDLGKKQIVELDDERRATLVGNLLVVLCGQTNPTPVINTGSLYT